MGHSRLGMLPSEENNSFWECFGKHSAWPRVRRRRQILLLREGEFKALFFEMRGASLETFRARPIDARRAEDCWTVAACFACNSMAGFHDPFVDWPWSSLATAVLSTPT